MSEFLTFDFKDPLVVLVGDVLVNLPRLADASVQCVVTSPPYWGLRDYKVPASEWPVVAFVPMAGLPPVKVPAMSCCLGLEPNPEAFVGHLVHVFREVHRVLREDGTCWVNLGDTFNSNPPSNGRSNRRDKASVLPAGRTAAAELKPKDMVAIPWRVALALQGDGWFLRSDIIWSKPNPMPESVTDRPTKAHEYFFLLSKAARYFYDAEAIKEGVTGNAHDRGNGVNPKAAKVPAGWDTTKGEGGHANTRGNGRYRPKQNESFSAAVCGLVSSRNKRSVWTVSTAPYPEAHFATFPPELIRPCILAGTSAGGCCGLCGAPYSRVLELGEPDLVHQRACGGNAEGEYHGTAQKDFGGAKVQNASEVKARILKGMVQRRTVGWVPGCDCVLADNLRPAVVPCVVLDPFGGSGTSGLVGLEEGRRVILNELNPAYVDLIKQRCAITPGLFRASAQPLQAEPAKTAPAPIVGSSVTLVASNANSSPAPCLPVSPGASLWPVAGEIRALEGAVSLKYYQKEHPSRALNGARLDLDVAIQQYEELRLIREAALKDAGINPVTIGQLSEWAVSLRTKWDSIAYHRRCIQELEGLIPKYQPAEKL